MYSRGTRCSLSSASHQSVFRVRGSGAPRFSEFSPGVGRLRGPRTGVGEEPAWTTQNVGAEARTRTFTVLPPPRTDVNSVDGHACTLYFMPPSARPRRVQMRVVQGARFDSTTYGAPRFRPLVPLRPVVWPFAAGACTRSSSALRCELSHLMRGVGFSRAAPAGIGRDNGLAVLPSYRDAVTPRE